MFLRAVAGVLAPLEEAAAATLYRRYLISFFFFPDILLLKAKREKAVHVPRVFDSCYLDRSA
jgi:hypothetical protein